MSESAKVRLVRCPKCENLLPEVTDFSVYQCGGCGAVLRSKNNGVDLDTFSEKSDEERFGSNLDKLSDRYEKMMNVSERRVMEMSDGSESDVRSNVSASSGAGRRRARREQAEIGRNVLVTEENWDVEADVMRDRRLNEIQQANLGQKVEDLTMFSDNEGGLRRLGRAGDGPIGEKSEMEGVWRAQRVDHEAGRRAKGGSFDHLSVSSCDFDDPSRSRCGVVDGLSNAEFDGDDRAELLRQLDELKYKLSRSGNLNEKGKEKAPLDRRMHPQGHYASENKVIMMQSSLKRAPFQNQYTESSHMMRRQDMGENDFYPPRYAPSHVQGYGNPSRAQGTFQMPPACGYVSGPYVDDGLAYMDNMEAYPLNFSRHHPSCSCYQCRAKRQISNPMMQAAYSGKYSNVSDDMVSNHSSFGARDHYNRRVLDQPLWRPRASQSHARWPSDVSSEVDGFVRRRPARPHLAGGGKHCSPIAGGAPFLTCNSCFELLMLPKKVVNKNGSTKKLRCGACSSLIAFVVSGKNLVFSLDVEAKNAPLKADNERDVPSRQGEAHPSQTRTAFSSGDYDISGDDFHSMDKEVTKIPRPGRDSKPIETRVRHSTSTYASEAEEKTKESTSAADVSREDKGPQPPTGSSLKDYFEHSNKFRVAKDLGEGNRSGCSDIIDRPLPTKTGARQILRKESLATEIDLSSNEFSNTGSTFESSEASRVGRGAGSFFAGIMGSFKDSHRSEDALKQEANVTVNGHLISDRLIKKAEKIAGPIQPGHYWYDFRAGFWGAIGGPCLGIIPPFIEEFNYPMPEHCAGGNTHVFVNGRELNHKDLNLLVGRGLPRERDRSYIVEISGRVLDEDTGEELESLGKLAPTMERVKRGFGMKIPQAIA